MRRRAGPGDTLALPLVVVAVALLLPSRVEAASQPARGGELVFVVPASGFPGMDAHRETTFAVIHPLRPFYSLLIQANPESPSNPVRGLPSWNLTLRRSLNV